MGGYLQHEKPYQAVSVSIVCILMVIFDMIMKCPLMIMNSFEMLSTSPKCYDVYAIKQYFRSVNDKFNRLNKQYYNFDESECDIFFISPKNHNVTLNTNAMIALCKIN